MHEVLGSDHSEVHDVATRVEMKLKVVVRSNVTVALAHVTGLQYSPVRVQDFDYAVAVHSCRDGAVLRSDEDHTTGDRPAGVHVTAPSKQRVDGRKTNRSANRSVYAVSTLRANCSKLANSPHAIILALATTRLRRGSFSLSAQAKITRVQLSDRRRTSLLTSAAVAKHPPESSLGYCRERKSAPAPR
jgi:hypothetical protein